MCITVFYHLTLACYPTVTILRAFICAFTFFSFSSAITSDIGSSERLACPSPASSQVLLFLLTAFKALLLFNRSLPTAEPFIFCLQLYYGQEIALTFWMYTHIPGGGQVQMNHVPAALEAGYWKKAARTEWQLAKEEMQIQRLLADRIRKEKG